VQKVTRWQSMSRLKETRTHTAMVIIEHHV